VSAYNKLTEQDITAVLAQYGLGAFRHCAPIKRGYVNEKWLLETEKGQFLLKRRHASLRRPSLVQAQHALVQHLRRAGFPAPALVRTRYNNTCVVHGGEVYEVQDYVPGDLFDAEKPPHLAAAACMLGFYHNAVRGFDHQALHRPEERYGYAALSRTVKGLLASWRQSIVPGLKPLMRRLEEHLQDLGHRYLAFTQLLELVIHGDYHGANLVFQEDRVVGVVDYDLAHWCSRAMEVAEATIAFCTDPGLGLQHIVYPGVLDLELVNGFLNAYQATVPLSEAEIAALPCMVRTIWLCASLDPPLEPALSLEAAPRALPEILALADWAAANEAELVRICVATRRNCREEAGMPSRTGSL
jgi:homoserine kinase type II